MTPPVIVTASPAVWGEDVFSDYGGNRFPSMYSGQAVAKKAPLRHVPSYVGT